MKRSTTTIAIFGLIFGASPALAQSGSGYQEIKTLEQQSWPSISGDLTIQGSLTTSDAKRKDGSYADGFFYEATAGESVTITMRSRDFDSWLVLDDPSGPLYQYNDDGGGGSDAQITVTFPHAGRYLILANDVVPGTTGNYTLTVARK